MLLTFLINSIFLLGKKGLEEICQIKNSNLSFCLNFWKPEIFLSIALSNQQLQWHFIKLSFKQQQKENEKWCGKFLESFLPSFSLFRLRLELPSNLRVKMFHPHSLFAWSSCEFLTAHNWFSWLLRIMHNV